MAKRRQWCPQPMLFAALSFAAGIVLVKVTLQSAWRPASWLLVSTAALFAIAVYWLRRRTRLSFLVVLSSFVVLGTLDYELYLTRPSPQIPVNIFNVPVMISGTVIGSNQPTLRSYPSEDQRSTASESRQMLDVETDEIVAAGQSYRRSLGVRLTIYATLDGSDDDDDDRRSVPEFEYGQRVRFETKLRQPRSFNNPGAWDYRGYLVEQGIAALGSAKIDSVQVLPQSGGTRFARWRSRVRESLIRHIQGLASEKPKNWFGRWFEISPEDAGLLVAMTLGDRSLLHRETKTDFQKTGSYHLLVVSGMNVAILAFAIFCLARILHIGDIPATILTILFSLLYASLTDLGTPIQRAVLMSAIYLCARLLYRDRQPLNAVAVAGLAVLVWNPSALFDAGFQLTFLAVLTIGGIGLPLLERSTGPFRSALRQIDSTAYDVHLEPRLAQFRLDLRMIAERLGYFVRPRFALWLLPAIMTVALAIFDLMLMSLLMQAALALPMAIYFHRLTVIGLPANVVVVPLISMLMPIVLIATLSSYLASWIAFLPKLLTAVFLHGISATIAVLARFNAANIRVADPSLWIAVTCATALVLCLLAARRHRVIAGLSLAALLLSAGLLLYSPRPKIHSGELEVTAIDVGQGDSILVVSPQGKILLIDGGGVSGRFPSEFDFGEDVVSPYLWSRGFEHLDAVALTHAHSDHIGGLPSVIHNFEPNELWIAPSAATSAYRGLMREGSEAGTTVIRRTAGEKFEFGGATIEVLWPPGNWRPGRDRNADSMVLRISYQDSAALLEGDAVSRNERQFPLSSARAQLLKVGHHGSNTSTSPELLAAVQPKYAVISAGAHNPFGHPRPEVLERLTNAGTHIFRTDVEGAVSFFFDGKQVTSAVAGGQQVEVPLRQSQNR
jgi:competence protein ComEC